MSQPPPPYERSFSFTDHSVNTPDLQQPGQKIDQELNNVLSTVNQTVSRLGEIQADDGKLRESAINGSTILQTAKNDAISAVNAAGTTNVAAVNAAGTTNVSAVTTAGQVAITAKDQAVASAAAAAVSASDANTQREMAQAARNDTFDSAAEVAAAEDNMIALAAGFTASANAALATANDAIQDAQDAITQAQEQVTLAAGHANDASESAGTAAISSSNAQYYAGVSQASAGEASTYRNQAQSFSSLASSSSITAVNASNASASHAGQAAASALAAADSAVSASNSAISAAASAAIATATTYAEPIRKIGSEVSIDPNYKPGAIPAPVDTTYPWLAVWDPYSNSWKNSLETNAGQLFSDQAGSYAGDFGSSRSYTGTPALRISQNGMMDWTEVTGEGIRFPDLSLQTTAGIPLPAVAGVDGQILSTNGVNPVWVDNAARTLFSAVRNETGATLAKGTVVYINGASGNKATVAKAQANGDATSATTFAVLSADIANNNNGTAIVVGELAGLDTSAYAEGAALYLSPTVAGGFTTTKPHAPNHIVYVATVTRSHANQGIIEVRIQNGYELDELHDVQAQAPNDGDGIFYDNSDQQWKTASVVSKVPAASDTVAGKVELATDNEVLRGLDDTKVVTVKALREIFRKRRFKQLPVTTWFSSTSGNGATSSATSFYHNINGVNVTGATGGASVKNSVGNIYRWDANSSMYAWKWSEGIYAGFSTGRVTTNTAHTIYFSIGPSWSSNIYGELGDVGYTGNSNRGFQVAINGANAWLIYYNGTTKYTSAQYPVVPLGSNRGFEVSVEYVDGTVTGYINGVAFGSVSGTPIPDTFVAANNHGFHISINTVNYQGDRMVIYPQNYYVETAYIQ